MSTETGVRVRRSPRDRALVSIVPVLVVLVAGVQVVRAATLHQSSWSGAGFGMFATYDSELHRFLLLEVERTDGSVVVVSPPFARAVVEAEVLPGRAELLAVADAADGRVDGRVLAVTVYGITFDDGDLGSYPIRRVEVGER